MNAGSLLGVGTLVIFGELGGSRPAGGTKVIVVIAFLLVVGGLIYYLNTASARKFRSLVELLDKGSVIVQPSVRVLRVEGRFRGRQAQVYHQKLGGRSETIFRLACSSPLLFGARKLLKVGPLTQLYRAEYAKVPAGDPELDEDYGFTSPHPDRFKAWVLRPENKQALKTVTQEVTRGEVCRVEVAAGCILWTGLNMWQIKPETAKPVLERLDAFARTLERSA